MSNVAAVRRHRERSKRGRKIYRVEADEAALELLLADAGLLPPSGSDDDAAVEAALRRLVEVLILDHCN